MLSYGVSKRDHPSVALGRGARADVVVKVGLEEGDRELRAAHLGDGCAGRDGGRVTKLVDIVSAEGEIRTQQKCSLVPKEAQSPGFKHALHEGGGAGVHCERL